MRRSLKNRGRALKTLAMVCLFLLGGFFFPAAYAATPVTTQPLTSLILYPQQTAPATVISLHDSPLSIEINGIIMNMPVKVGQWVARGEVLARLDPWHHENQLKQAQAALEESLARLQLAQRQKERTERLRQSGQASEALWEQRNAEINILAARIQQQRAVRKAASDRIQKTRLKAPFAGMITERTGRVGAWSSPGVPVLRLVDVRQMELSATLRPDQRRSFDPAWRGQFLWEGTRHPVRLRALVALQDPRTRLQEARLVFMEKATSDTPDPSKLRPIPGAAGRLVWKDPRPHVPARLLVRRGGRLGLFFAEGNTARFYPLPQAREGQPAPLSPPFPTHGLVILSGRETLQDGTALPGLPNQTTP